ncbi:MAG: hypothetical protein K2X27_28585 [Candidatus Obscuribacterales bacterium]|nr:hypothetical protein [Candidatus Obscuribacterales bacterium]
MSDSNDLTRKKAAARAMDATVPDIFALSSRLTEIPGEHTLIRIADSASLNFPGKWVEAAQRGENGCKIYRQTESLAGTLSVGYFNAAEKFRQLILALCQQEAHAMLEAELNEVRNELSGTRHSSSYFLSAGSTEALNGKLLIVLQGFFPDMQIKEALICGPANERDFFFLSLQALKPEFPIYFNHLRLALKTLEWN